MVFTDAAEAKPKHPHRDGLPCLACGALVSSWWRGPGSRYCCQKEAAAAREAQKADVKDTRIFQLEQRLAATEAGLAQAVAQIAELRGRQDDSDAAARAHGQQLQAGDEAIRGLQQQLCSVAQVQLMLPRPSQAVQAGAKRRALGDASNVQ